MPHSQLPLEGIRILDLSQLIAGPSATAMLAELGAEVIKLEAPEGDTSRKMGQGRKHGHSATFAAYNKGKRSIALDLQSPRGLEIAKRLIAKSDVVVQAFRPGVIERLGLGYEAASALKPEIVYVSFSGFGDDGPMAKRSGVDLLIQGEAGIMSITGEPDRDPMKIGFTAVDAAAGFALAKSILAGLVQRLRTGRGSHLKMSLMDVALFMQAGPITEYLMTGEEPKRTGNNAPLGAPAEVFNTSDGTLILSAYFPSQWPDLCTILDLPELIAHPDYHDNATRIRNRAALHGILQARIATFTTDALKAALEPTRIIYGDVLGYEKVVSHPQVVHNGTIRPFAAAGGSLESVAAPLKLEGIARREDLTLPSLGAQGREILSELGYSAADIDDLSRSGVLA